MKKRELITSNPYTCLRILLEYHGRKCDSYTRNLLESHPLYPSIESVAYVLSRYGIDSSLIESDMEEIYDLPKPLLLHYNDLYLPVTRIDAEGNCFILNEKVKEEYVSDIDIRKFWTGRVLLIDAKDKYIKIPFSETIGWRFSRISFLILIIAIVSSFLVFLTRMKDVYSPFNVVFFLTSLSGLVLGGLFHVQKLDRGNSLVGRICHSRKEHSNRDCSSILDSKDAVFLGIVSWVDIGCVYFLITTFLLFFYDALFSSTIIAFLSVLSAAYIPYSIIYQWKISHKWCTLCLLTQGLLLINFITAILFFLNGKYAVFDIVSLVKLASFVACGLSIWALYVLATKALYSFTDLKKRQDAFNRFRYTSEGLACLLNTSTTLNYESLTPIAIIEREDPLYDVTIIVNPSCSPCMSTARSVVELIRRKYYTNLSVIFLIDPNDSATRRIAQVLIESCERGNACSVFYDYVNNYPRSVWKNMKGKEEYNNSHSLGIIDSHYKWAISNGIMATPKIVFNGHILTDLYKVTDLDYITE